MGNGKPEKAEDDLSERENDVMKLLMQGLSNRQIADDLRISEKTVEKHLTSIYTKAGVSSRSEAILWGLEKGRDFPT